MYAQVEKPKENKSRAAANSPAQKKINGTQGFWFMDNRPEAVAQKRLQMKVKNDSSINKIGSMLKAVPIDVEKTSSTNKQHGLLTQMKAWHKRRPLAQADGETQTASSVFNGRGPLHHAHIVFDRGYVLPIVGDTDNVGYHAVDGASGPGELFSENVSVKGYKSVEQITQDPYEDRVLIQSIEKNKNFGEYKLVLHDCQNWVDKVKADYEANKSDGVELQDSGEMLLDRQADLNTRSKNAALHSTHKQVFSSIGNDGL